ncbi:methyltransferase family protein [Murinocardiopsis flavida]|uniref:Methyltransferase family protein n=1 Tax=Murinocardiopsis flavida TaxID=645275 RepID=A0A2P8DG65_9ACTN|nr:class I SAM-dependent methyltransferase [Murinocardiopsis flavida]PSK96207.1 methyltransferase family protein [Murinocardiopsis flavida]
MPDTPNPSSPVIYRPRTLALYDTLVLGASCRWVWRCPAENLVEVYRDHLGPVHLDIGVGTGHLLDRATAAEPATPLTGLHLLDTYPGPLSTAAQRLSRHQPRTYRADARTPFPLAPASMDSVGSTFLLHCLPGRGITEKAVLFDNIAAVAVRGGAVFGATLLPHGPGVHATVQARALMDAYNRAGWLSNRGDTVGDLKRELHARFDQVQVRVVGCVALWTAVAR